MPDGSLAAQLGLSIEETFQLAGGVGLLVFWRVYFACRAPLTIEILWAMLFTAVPGMISWLFVGVTLVCESNHKILGAFVCLLVYALAMGFLASLRDLEQRVVPRISIPQATVRRKR